MSDILNPYTCRRAFTWVDLLYSSRATEQEEAASLRATVQIHLAAMSAVQVWLMGADADLSVACASHAALIDVRAADDDVLPYNTAEP